MAVCGWALPAPSNRPTGKLGGLITQTVALFVHSLIGGGAERVLVNLANNLALGGAKVHLVLVEKSGPYVSMVSELVEIIELKGTGSVASSIKLADYLKERKPDHLIACMESALIACALAKKLSGSRAKLYFWEHITPSAHFKMTKSAKERLMPPLVRWAVRGADWTIAVSEGSARDLIEFYRVPAAKVVTIPNPIQVEDIRSKATQEVEHPWSNQPNTKVLLGAGRFNPQKGFDVLIKAFAQVRKLGNYKLIIIGQGPLKDDLEALVKVLGLEQDVWLPGYLANPFAMMAKCDLFVLSSLYEALPTVLIEALVCGANVVSTDCPSGPHEILEGGKYGQLVKVGSAEALAEGILSSIARPMPKWTEAQVERFRPEVVTKQFQDLLERKS